MPTPTELCLHIISCQCTCGNAWTHSRPLLAGQGMLGGTPGPLEEHRFPVTSLMRSQYHYSHCFRCAPLGLGEGWQAPALLPASLGAPKQTKPRTRITNPDEGIFDD